MRIEDHTTTQDTVMRRHHEEHALRDPVCGMEVSRKSAVGEATHHGKTYYFCAPSCLQAFEADPEKFVHHHRQHGMKAR